MGLESELKMKVQILETENMVLKFSYTSTSIIYMDLNKFVGQRPSNKSGLAYEKSSNTSNCPKYKEKQSQWSNTKIMKPNNTNFF
jgi:hypothetical protein